MSAVSAFRRDAAAGRADSPDAHAAFLTVASLIEQAAAAESDAMRAHLHAAATVAVREHGTATVRAEAIAEWDRATATDLEILYLATVAIERAGLYALAESMCATVVGIEGTNDVDRGRFMVLRARLARRLGDTDIARDRYLAAARLARRIANEELAAGAELGLATLAQLRGNIPEMLRRSRRVIRLAHRVGLPRIAREAHMAVVRVTADRGEFDLAIDSAWSMLACSRSDAQHAADLATLAKLLVEMNRPEAAIKVIGRLLAEPAPALIVVAALGTFAVAAARTGNTRQLDWTLGEIRAFRTSIVARYQYVSTLIDAATALRIAERRAEAAAFRAEALALATKLQFHEFVHRAEAMDLDAPEAMPEVAPVRAAGAKVLRSIERWKPARLPRRARVAGVAAG